MTTKQRIFEAATELFAKDGYNNVSTKEIAARVGITDGGIYRHYVSKASILEDILDTYKQTHMDFLISKRQIDSYIKNHTPRELLEYCSMFFSEDRLVFVYNALRIVFNERLTNPAANDILRDHTYSHLLELIKYALDVLVERGDIPQTDTFAFSSVWAQAVVFHAGQWVSSRHDDKTKQKALDDYTAMSAWMIEAALTGKIPVG